MARKKRPAAVDRCDAVRLAKIAKGHLRERAFRTLVDVPQLAYDYLVETGSRHRTLESSVATRMNLSLEYARIKQIRFHKAERLLATSARHAYQYAVHLKRRFPEGEASIATSGKWSAHYAHFQKKRFRQGEPAIVVSPYLREYLTTLVRTRDTSIETLCLSHPRASLIYALDILKIRWPQAESQWQKAFGDPQCEYFFREYIHRFIPFQNAFMDRTVKMHPQFLVDYARGAYPLGWPDGEAILLTSPDCVNQILRYGREVTRGRLPAELHNRLIFEAAFNQRSPELMEYLTRYPADP